MKDVTVVRPFVFFSNVKCPGYFHIMPSSEMLRLQKINFKEGKCFSRPGNSVPESFTIYS